MSAHTSLGAHTSAHTSLGAHTSIHSAGQTSAHTTACMCACLHQALTSNLEMEKEKNYEIVFKIEQQKVLKFQIEFKCCKEHSEYALCVSLQNDVD